MSETESLVFSISENAAKRINFLVSQEDNPDSMLRIAVLGGGCSGFQYEFNFDTESKDDDQIFENNGARVVIDETSLPFVEHSMLDFEESLTSSLFTIKNPNATANCGCGNSFSV